MSTIDSEIGFLGLGAMGAAMARRLVDHGYDVRVWNRSQDAVNGLVAAGATRADSVEHALSTAVSISMLANDAAAAEVLRAEAWTGVAGRMHINMASVSPKCADQLAERAAAADVHYLAAPVLGRPSAAQEGKLNVIVAGGAETISRAQPILSVLGARTWEIGEHPRLANVVKIAVNYNIVHAIQALAESVSMVEAHGIEADTLVDLLTGTLFGGVVYSGYGRAISERRYLPAGFAMPLGLKDLHLAQAVAAEGGAQLPTAGVLEELFIEALADPRLKDSDWAGVAEITRGRRT